MRNRTAKASIRHRNGSEDKTLTKNLAGARTEGKETSQGSNMLPRALVGEIELKNRLEFIDAIYAIILTLLLIELPSTILDLIKEYTEHPDLRGIVLNSLTMTILDFLSLFIVIYDVCAHHRVALKEAVLNRTNLSLGVLCYFCVH